MIHVNLCYIIILTLVTTHIIIITFEFVTTSINPKILLSYKVFGKCKNSISVIQPTYMTDAISMS